MLRVLHRRATTTTAPRDTVRTVLYEYTTRRQRQSRDDIDEDRKASSVHACLHYPADGLIITVVVFCVASDLLKAVEAMSAGIMSAYSLADLQSTLLTLRDNLAQQDTEAVKASVEALQHGGTAELVMDQLAPSLFQDIAGIDKLNNQDSLRILSLLVSSDTARYLRAGAKSVRNQAVKLVSSADPMIVSPALLAVMVSQLSSKEVAVSSHADESLVACCRKMGVDRLGNAALKSVVAAWRTAWNGGGNLSRSEASTICVRCASCVADIVAIGDDFMKAALANGAMNLILELLGDENDVLLEMASLDIIEKMITIQPTHHERTRWLFSKDVLLPLLEMAGGTEGAKPDSVLSGPALRVVSQLCKLGHCDAGFSGLVEDYLLKGFHQALHNFNAIGEVDRLAKIDAISSFAGASSDALNIVLDDPITREEWLSISVAQPKLKAAILHSIAMVLDPTSEADVNGDTIMALPPLSDSARNLYAMFGKINKDEPSKLAIALAKSPLPEIRLGAYALMTAVAKLPTGGQILFGEPQFLDFFLTREGESTKEGREARYKLVETIQNSDVKGLLADDIVKRIEKYLQQGAYFVETVSWELATEG